MKSGKPNRLNEVINVDELEILAVVHCPMLPSEADMLQPREKGGCVNCRYFKGYVGEKLSKRRYREKVKCSWGE